MMKVQLFKVIKLILVRKIEDKLLDSDSDKIKWVKVDKESDLKKDSIMRNIMGSCI